jgi:restriction system protein
MDIKSNSGNFIFENRVGWAFTYLTKAEYIKKSSEKALYEITDLGCTALKDSYENNLIIDESYLKTKSPNYLSNWQVNRSEKNQPNPTDSLSDKVLNINEFEMNLEESIDQFNRQFEDELLNKIKNLSWQDFEDLCSRLIEKMGYGVSATRTIRVRDGGIDGEIFEDELGINGVIYIQAKRYDNNNISVNDIKNFLHIPQNITCLHDYELITYMLKADVDILFFAGIGTYIKDQQEWLTDYMKQIKPKKKENKKQIQRDIFEIDFMCD